MSLSITALVRQPGIHHWPDAHHVRSYLRNPHRHTFYIRVTVPVGHDDRAVEFHDLSVLVGDALRDRYPAWAGDFTVMDFGARSCERIAEALASDLAPLIPVSVSVAEDDEYTATWAG